MIVEALPPFIPFGQPFQRLCGPSRTTQAELIREGAIRSVLVGEKRGRRMIETASYLEYLERQRRREAAGEIGGRSTSPRARQRPAPTPAIGEQDPVATSMMGHNGGPPLARHRAKSRHGRGAQAPAVAERSAAPQRRATAPPKNVKGTGRQ